MSSHDKTLTAFDNWRVVAGSAIILAARIFFMTAIIGAVARVD